MVGELRERRAEFLAGPVVFPKTGVAEAGDIMRRRRVGGLMQRRQARGDQLAERPLRRLRAAEFLLRTGLILTMHAQRGTLVARVTPRTPPAFGSGCRDRLIPGLARLLGAVERLVRAAGPVGDFHPT